MSRLVTLTTLQWADLDLETTCKLAKEMGYDGLEIGCVGTHFDVKRAATEPEYVEWVKGLLEKYGLPENSIYRDYRIVKVPHSSAK